MIGTLALHTRVAMQACAARCMLPGQGVSKCCLNFVKIPAVLTANSATNHLFESNLCNALIRRNDAIDL